MPRILASPMDALFTAHFVRKLVLWHTPNFNFIMFVRRALYVLMPLIRSTSECETLNMATFLLELFGDLSKMMESEKVFREWSDGNCCFLKSINAPENGYIGYEMFLKVRQRDRVQCRCTITGWNSYRWSSLLTFSPKIFFMYATRSTSYREWRVCIHRNRATERLYCLIWRIWCWFDLLKWLMDRERTQAFEHLHKCFTIHLLY